MKKIFPTIVLLLFVYCIDANAQFGKLKDALNNAAGSLLNSKQMKLLQTDPITTNFDDCNKTEIMPVNFGVDAPLAGPKEKIARTLAKLLNKDDLSALSSSIMDYLSSEAEVVIYVPKTLASINYLPVGTVAVPASRGSQRLGQSNLLVCEK